MRVPELYIDYSECNCDQALLYLSIINRMVEFALECDYCTSKEKQLYETAIVMVEKFKKDYPSVDLDSFVNSLYERSHR